MYQRYNIVVSGVLMVGLLAGCFSNDELSEQPRDEDPERTVEERYGALSAEFVYPRSGVDHGVEVQAQFLDVRGVAVEPAMEALEVWMPRRGLEMDTCIIDDGADVSSDRYQPVSLHLLDLGDIAVSSPDERVILEPRRLPDLLSSFYGVVYGSEWSDLASDNFVEYYPGATYRFTAPGTVEAGTFDVSLQAPEPIVLLAADGDEIRDRTSYSTVDNQPLELVWETDGALWGAEEVFIDLFAGYGPDQARIQCRTRDHGAFSIPSSKLRELSRTSDEVDLQLRRVRRSEASIRGLDEVDFYFSTTDGIELHFR